MQVHSLPATLMVSVEASPLPDSIAMHALARALTSLLQHTGAWQCVRVCCTGFVHIFSARPFPSGANCNAGAGVLS